MEAVHTHKYVAAPFWRHNLLPFLFVLPWFWVTAKQLVRLCTLTHLSLAHHSFTHTSTQTHASTTCGHIFVCAHMPIHMCTCMHTHYTHICVQADPAQLLSLRKFVCRNVSVSFVVVNKHGSSTESPAATIIVPSKGIQNTNLLIHSNVPLIYSTFQGHWTHQLFRGYQLRWTHGWGSLVMVWLLSHGNIHNVTQAHTSFIVVFKNYFYMQPQWV